MTNRRPVIAAVVAVIALVVALVIVMARGRLYAPAVTSVEAMPIIATRVETAPDEPSTLAPYAGLGAWLDAFDFSPAYGPDGEPALDAAVTVEEMDAAGVKTIFIQAARFSSRTAGLLEDEWVLADILVRAHQRDMDVVAWYLPALDNRAEDADRIAAMRDFTVLGHRFDGIAIDIEADPEPTPEELALRNAALLDISVFTRDVASGMPVGAIVLPPPLIEEVNEQFWPEFPWLEISEFYDVWLPMSYWSGRSDASGYGDGYAYSLESARRIRERIDQPDAPVHGIGGIGGVAGERDFTATEILASIDDYPLFAQSLADADAIGGSIYDWNTQDEHARQSMQIAFARGAAANLPAAPDWVPAEG